MYVPGSQCGHLCAIGDAMGCFVLTEDVAVVAAAVKEDSGRR